MQITITGLDGNITPDEHRLLRAIVDALATKPSIADYMARQQNTGAAVYLPPGLYNVDKPTVMPVADNPETGTDTLTPGTPAAAAVMQQAQQVIAERSAAQVFGGALPLPLPATATSTPPAPPPTTSDASPLTDATGLPWDARIHSTPGVLTEKGVWRKRRGLNDEGKVRQVEAELRALAGSPPPSGNTLVPPSAAAAAYISSEAAAVPLPPAASSATPTTFAQLIAWMVPLLQAKKIDRAELDSLAQQLGVPTLVALAGRDDLVPAMYALVGDRD